MEEKNNVLFSQDDLMEQPNEVPQNNLENGYTEELDFLQPEIQKAEEVQPVPVEPNYEEPQAEQPKYEDTVAAQQITVQNKDIIMKENPMGKIRLNKQEEKKEEQIDPASIKVDLKGNKNLTYVLILGLILLIAVIIIPMFITKVI